MVNQSISHTWSSACLQIIFNIVVMNECRPRIVLFSKRILSEKWDTIMRRLNMSEREDSFYIWQWINDLQGSENLTCQDHHQLQSAADAESAECDYYHKSSAYEMIFYSYQSFEYLCLSRDSIHELMDRVTCYVMNNVRYVSAARECLQNMLQHTRYMLNNSFPKHLGQSDQAHDSPRWTVYMTCLFCWNIC